MSWGEALRQTVTLMSDPSTQVAAATGGWDYPVSRLDLTLRDLYDLTHQVASVKRVKPYSRPWAGKKKRRAQPDAGVTQSQIVAALRHAGHTANLPSVTPV